MPPQTPSRKPLAGLSLDLSLSFAQESEVRPGLEATRTFFRETLSSFKPQSVPEELRPLATILFNQLRDADWRQEGNRIRLAVQFRWQASVMGNLVQTIRQTTAIRAAAGATLNRLRQIALAMHNYHDMHKRFPPAVVYGKNGKPLYSWRVLLLPHLGQQQLFDQFHRDEPWDSEHNKKLLARMPSVYAIPRNTKNKDANEQTYFQVFVGPGAGFEGRQGPRIPIDFQDGTANTLLVAEAAEAVPWTSPRDLVYQPGQPLPKLGGHIPGRFNAAYVDGHARTLKTNLPEKVLRA